MSEHIRSQSLIEYIARHSGEKSFDIARRRIIAGLHVHQLNPNQTILLGV